MADVLDLYNSISDAADKALSKGAALLEQSKVLSNLKPIAGTLAHGAIGPGIMLADPLQKFVTGEAAFHKAAAEFVVDAKQLQMGGTLASKGIGAAGEAWATEGTRVGKSLQWLSKTAKEWTNTAGMMEDTLKSLAGKTGALATGFRGAATIIKVATGPIATALLATTAAYEHFVKQWIEDSEKLQASIKATAGVFKGGDFASIAQGAHQFAQAGGSRQDFLNTMQTGGGVGQNLNSRTATQLVELAKVQARESGKTMAEEFQKNIHTFQAMQSEGVAPHRIQQEITQRRVIAGGPDAGRSMKNPLDAYREWGENVGRNLNIGSQGAGISEGISRMQYLMPGRPIKDKLHEGMVNASDSAYDNLHRLPLFSGISQAGNLISKVGEAYAGASSKWDTYLGKSNLAESERLLGTGNEADRERGIRHGVLGTRDLASGSMKQFEISATAEQKKNAAEEAKVSKQEQIVEAARMRERGKELGPKVIEDTKNIRDQLQKAAESGNADELEAARKSAEKLAAANGKNFQELINIQKATDQWGHLLPSSDNLEKAADEAQKARAELEKKKKFATELQKSAGVLQGMTGEIPAAAMSQRDIYSQTPAQLEEQERAHQKSIAAAQRTQREMQLIQKGGGTLTKDQKEKLAQAQRDIVRGRSEETGVSAETEKLVQKHTEAAQKLEKEGKTAEAQKEYEKAQKAQQEGYKTTDTHVRRIALQEAQKKLQMEQQESGVRIARTQLPVSVAAMKERGVLQGTEGRDVERMLGNKPEDIGSDQAQRIEMKLKEAQAKHEAEIQKVDLKFVQPQRELQARGAGIQAGMMGATGAMSPEQVKEAQDLAKKGDEVSIHNAEKLIELAQTRQKIEQAAVEARYAKTEQKLAGEGIGVQAKGMAESGVLDEERVKKVQDLVAKGDAVALQEAQKILSIAEKRKQIEEGILQIRVQSITRTGERAGIGIQAASLQRQGALGPEAGMINNIAQQGSNREFDAAKGTMTNILNIRKKMFQDEISFTVQYATARMNIIKTHYENVNELEKTKLESKDRKYAPAIQYAGTVAQAQQTMVGAQMGRYAGQDYWRQQDRGARGIREEGTDLAFSLAGGSVPREVQQVRAIRAHRERKEDFKRQQARQQEEDTANIDASTNTEKAVQDQIKQSGGSYEEFKESAGGQEFLLGQLQKNQAAYSRQGIDVSGQIKELAGKQQERAGKKMANEMQSRKMDSESMTQQIGVMEEEVNKLKPGEQQQKAQVELAGKYKEAAALAGSQGDVEKQKQYQEKQESILKDVPAILKKDFGDTAKQSLNELKTQTEVLNAINEALGGEKPGSSKDEDTGIEGEAAGGEEGKGKGGAKEAFGGHVSRFGEAIDKMIKNTIRVVVTPAGGGSSSGGDAGSYGGDY